VSNWTSSNLPLVAVGSRFLVDNHIKEPIYTSFQIQSQKFLDSQVVELPAELVTNLDR